MENDPRDISAYIHKTVPFRYAGVGMTMSLSQGAFSSHDVDEGSKLLLKTIAQNVDVAACRTVLDVGCGVGVLGIALNKRHPDLSVTMVDRSVFAVALAQLNASSNAVSAEVVPSLGFAGLGEDDRYNLIVSNYPAKAGEPVIADFLCRLGAYLTPEGRACVVFVGPLADVVDAAVMRCGLEVLFRESTKGHFVLHLRGGGGGEGDPLAAYIRTAGTASFAGFRYHVETVYGLPEFDTLSFRTELLRDSVPNPAPRSLLLVNPGQGHVACAVSRPGSTVTLASDDMLQIAVTRRNLLRNGVEDLRLDEIAHLGEVDAQARPRVALVSFDPIPSSDWIPHAVGAMESLVAGGSVSFASTSTVCHRLEKALAGTAVRLVSSKKYRGQRLLSLATNRRR